MIRRVSRMCLVALAVALTLGACGGGGGTPAAKTLSVEAIDFGFAPNAFTAKVGEDITFSISNKGALEHNFVVFDPSGAEVGRTSIAIGATGSLTVKPSVAGAYSVVCDIAGHKEAGMVATLTVSP